MIPFLKNVANAFFKAHKHNVSNYAFVFPNRRAGLFFQKYLAEIAKQPVFSPPILTVSDLFSLLSGYKTADRIEMLFILYGEYIRISKSDESFDDFLFWGEMILNDFDDVDKYMVDAEQLFRNIYDLKEIDAGFTYLTDEQIAAIRRFWNNFLPLNDSESKKDFLKMWEVLFELYSSLRSVLASRGLAYEGMIFREVAEKAKANDDLKLPFSQLVFVGLNAHSKSEETLLKHLARIGVADFYWDYSSPLVKDPFNKASFFIDKNRQQFPGKLSLDPEEQTFEKPVVEVIGIPSMVGQAKYVHTILDSFITEGVISKPEDALNTAVVLPDENLLLPTLYSIPQGIDKINVTMGYSLSNSSISGLMNLIFEVQRNIRYVDGNLGFYYRSVLPILNHKYIVGIVGDEARRIKLEINQNNRTIVLASDLHVHPLLNLIFRYVERWSDVPDYLRKILTLLQTSLFVNRNEDDEIINARSADMEREFVIEYYKTINKMDDALKHVHADMLVETYLRLLKKMVVNISVPFSGEPLSGLQVMGVLETRAIDFENLIILSMNEGIFPKKKAANSFVPYNLRRGFGLPTYEHQDSIFSYHFYRMINRARRIYLLYDTRTEGLQTGEVSRYFLQLKHIYADMFDIRERLAVYEVSSTESLSIAVQKDASVLEKMKAFSSGERSLSASAINTYLDCPLQFYFSVVEGIQQEDEISETIEADVFGSIFHSVMEWLYDRFEGQLITADLLQAIAKDNKLLTEVIERSFAKNFFKIDPSKARKLVGQNYLTGEVIKRYVKRVLSTDAKLTPFKYIESEKRLEKVYTLPTGLNVSLKGFIDRVDEIKGHTRIIDYKTGRGILQFKSIEHLFDKEAKDRPKAVMQVFMYAHLYMLENPEKILEPGIYYLRNLFDERFDPNVIYKPSLRDLYRVNDFSEYQTEFVRLFDDCLTEIFNANIPFTQTTTGKACEWCKFTGICKK
ncbi:PD-(D/E)XK nuclease family protein [Dysgonomonas sp. 216]|uniref:PD-(D/E)XK nuclease family protein n=1 Tax=Dysgonomonas sp. 216 TaxID=2302934 RepID=UPI0013D2ED29|nr:PD-(D/E)XK nuclease family protein [Dysgonomonas sp. 216]NDW19234.1 PD-(D/E)XK nuclease family protein [Dysgonomonas sp. 216]